LGDSTQNTLKKFMPTKTEERMNTLTHQTIEKGDMTRMPTKTDN